MKIVCIYKITSPTGKVYIGQTIDFVSRMQGYARLECKMQTKLYHSFQKHGWANHKVEILCQCDKSKLNDLEKHYAVLHNVYNNLSGLNIRECGGSHGCLSEESKLKISQSKKGSIPWNKGKHGHLPEESLQRLRNRPHSKKAEAALALWIKTHPSPTKGIKHTAERIEKNRLWHLGRKRSLESVEKTRIGNLGQKRSLEVIEKMKLAQKNRIITPEHRQKITLALTGRKQSPEHIEKVRQGHLGKKYKPRKQKIN